MTQSYADFLRANGATDDEVKVLDVAPARKAFDAQLKATEKMAAEHAAAIRTHNDEVQKWYNDQLAPQLLKLQSERDTYLAESAADKARVKALQDQGLLAVAQQAQAEPAKPEAAAGPDLSKYVTTDILTQVADREGDAIAIMADIAEEHRELFGTRINARELRAEAKKQNKSIEQFWMEKHGVQAKREAAAAASKEAYEKKLREEGAATERAKFQTTNPNLVVAESSRVPFTKADPNSNAQPWNRTDSEKTQGYVNKVLSNLQQPKSAPVN